MTARRWLLWGLRLARPEVLRLGGVSLTGMPARDKHRNLCSNG